MTKDTEEFSQFTDSVTCREDTLPRDESLTEPKRLDSRKHQDWTRIGSYNLSWVRISHGLNKLVTDLIDKEYDDNEQETSETKPEEFALKTNVLAFASRSKAKAKPRRRTSTCSSARTVPIGERKWTDIEPEDCPVSKQLSTLLRHGHLPREEDGAIEFWRLKDDLRNDFESSQRWSDEMWKSKMAGGGGNKKRFQYCTDPSGQEILYLRAFQDHSGRNFIDPSLQEQYLNSERFLRIHLSHRMCNQFTLHHEFRIDTRRTKFEQKTDGILYVCGSFTVSCMVQAEIGKRH